MYRQQNRSMRYIDIDDISDNIDAQVHNPSFVAPSVVRRSKRVGCRGQAFLACRPLPTSARRHANVDRSSAVSLSDLTACPTHLSARAVCFVQTYIVFIALDKMLANVRAVSKKIADVQHIHTTHCALVLCKAITKFY